MGPQLHGGLNGELEDWGTMVWAPGGLGRCWTCARTSRHQGLGDAVSAGFRRALGTRLLPGLHGCVSVTPVTP